MQELDITIVGKLGKGNVVFDFLSRLQATNDSKIIVDIFYDEHLLSISVRNPWHGDISNCLSTNKIPYHFSPKEKRQLIEKSFNFSWIANFFFYTRPNKVMRRCIQEDG